ncbi:MAG: hypothetical protein P8Z38_05615 [Robiginitalea sp.]|jgi:hypothetical protein
MKIKRGIYYGSALGGATLLIFSSAFEIPELSMAVGFALLMAGLYGLTIGRGNGATEENKTDEEIQEGRQGSNDR